MTCRYFQIILSITLAAAVVACFGCNQTDEPPHYNITIGAEDIGVTDGYFHLSSVNSVPGSTVQVELDGRNIMALAGDTFADTTILVTPLAVRHSYTLQAFRIFGEKRIDSSNALPFTTLDITSHEFSFRVDTLGDGRNSVLKDVAIVNDSCIWAVGELYKRDSNGVFDINMYNAVRWDGKKWNYYRVQTTICGTSGRGAFRLTSVVAFGEQDVWMTTGGTIEHWDGKVFTSSCAINPLVIGELDKFWGRSDKDIYLAGRVGSIMHSDGSQWTRNTVNPGVDISDIQGRTTSDPVFCVGFYTDKLGTFVFRQPPGGAWELCFDGTDSEVPVKLDSLSGVISTLYFPSPHRLFLGSTSGLYETNPDRIGPAKRNGFTKKEPFPGFPRSLRGLGSNDMILAGDLGFLAHYNGASVRFYAQFYTENLQLFSATQRGDLCAAAGISYDPHGIDGRGIVITGRRK